MIDLVVSDEIPGERLGVSPPCRTYESRPPNAESPVAESQISDSKSTPCDCPKTEQGNPNDQGSTTNETPPTAEGIGHSDLDIGHSSQTIGTTSNHSFWSEDRQEFVQAGSLEIGERLQTLSGDVKVVQQKLPRPGPQPVFNLEVHAEHVYCVGLDGVLVHNSCDEWNDFLASNKGRFVGSDWHEQASAAYLTSKLENLAAADSVTRVFWSGGTVAKRSAAGLAQKLSGTTLEMTSAGQYLARRRAHAQNDQGRTSQICRVRIRKRIFNRSALRKLRESQEMTAIVRCLCHLHSKRAIHRPVDHRPVNLNFERRTPASGATNGVDFRPDRFDLSLRR